MTTASVTSSAAAVAANKQLAIRFLELVAAHDIDALCALVTPTWTMTGGPPGLPAGPEGIRILFGTFGKIEQEWAAQDVIAEGDRVVVRAVNTCDQETFLGVPSNGRTQVFTATFVHRIAGTPDRPLIDQTWRNADDLGRLLQLGAKIVA
ncbi:nuclear transport factor 2 family protein [Dactylosporangium sp. NPDC049525]|uniref:nuclear transport factor 2 family protein n=1 Tax=Dactylosporangium sp. NPDC049525 TaxID=3154730 RepID=UPI00343959D6